MIEGLRLEDSPVPAPSSKAVSFNLVDSGSAMGERPMREPFAEPPAQGENFPFPEAIMDGRVDT
jgi:hypothetical protein